MARLDMTPKQEKLVDIIVENVVNKGTRKTKEQMLLEAGYKAPTARAGAKRIINSPKIQASLQEVLGLMEDVRHRSLLTITQKKLEKSSAKDLSSISETMTKQTQLLSGGATENNKVTIVFDDAFKDRAI